VHNQALRYLKETRALNFGAAFFLSLQFYGNLYEENIAISNVTNPVPGRLVQPLDPGSPLYFYVPWVLIGIYLAIALLVRTRSYEPAYIRRDLMRACYSLVIVVAAKVFLITQVNDTFRDSTVSKEHFIYMGWVWLIVNGVAILAGGFTLVMLLRWRRMVLEAVGSSHP